MMPDGAFVAGAESGERHADQLSRRRSFSLLEWIGLCLLFCLPAIFGMARHPLWIDEMLTLFPSPTESSSFESFCRGFLNFPGSIRYTPLYVMLVAAWARIVPATELALRSLNLPFLLGVALLSRAFVARLPIRSPAAKWAALASIALSPFYVYYTFDLRPYASLICFGGMIITGLVLVEEWDRKGPWLIAAGFCLAFLTQPPVILLAPVIGSGVLLLFLRDARRSLRLWMTPGIVGTVVTAVTALYYQLVRSGGGMEAWGGGGFIKNILFIGYEFAGFSGLGPTRSQLRSLAPPTGRESTVAPLSLSWNDWLPAILFALVWGILLLVLARGLWIRRTSRWWTAPSVRWPAVMFFGGIIILSVFFYIIQYRFLSRHISFLYVPFAYLLLGCAAHAPMHTLARVLYALLLSGFAASSAQLLFNPGYMREDPRGMIRAWQGVRANKGAVNLWAFYPAQSMLYYGSDRNLPNLRGNTVSICDRIGPASYRETALPDLAAAHPETAPVISLDSPGRELWQKLLTTHRGRRVVIGMNRGTEFDHQALAKELLADPAAQAVKLGEWPLVECFECVVP